MVNVTERMRIVCPVTETFGSMKDCHIVWTRPAVRSPAATFCADRVAVTVLWLSVTAGVVGSNPGVLSLRLLKYIGCDCYSAVDERKLDYWAQSSLLLSVLQLTKRGDATVCV